MDEFLEHMESAINATLAEVENGEMSVEAARVELVETLDEYR